MTAPLRYRAMQPGSGRTGGAVKRAVEVESLPCPKRDGNHLLRNSAKRGGLVSACVGCGRTWSELDADARAGR